MESKERWAVAVAGMLVALGFLMGFLARPHLDRPEPPWACLNEHVDEAWLVTDGTLMDMREAVRGRIGVEVVSFQEILMRATMDPEGLVGERLAVLVDYFPLGGCVAVDVIIYTFHREGAAIGLERSFVAFVFDRHWNEVHRTEYRLAGP